MLFVANWMSGWQSVVDRIKKASDSLCGWSWAEESLFSLELMASDCVGHVSNLLVRKLDYFRMRCLKVERHFLFLLVSAVEELERAEPPPRSANCGRVHLQEVVLGYWLSQISSSPTQHDSPGVVMAAQPDAWAAMNSAAGAQRAGAVGPSPNECWEIGAATQTETLIDLLNDGQEDSAV